MNSILYVKDKDTWTVSITSSSAEISSAMSIKFESEKFLDCINDKVNEGFCKILTDNFLKNGCLNFNFVKKGSEAENPESEVKLKLSETKDEVDRFKKYPQFVVSRFKDWFGLNFLGYKDPSKDFPEEGEKVEIFREDGLWQYKKNVKVTEILCKGKERLGYDFVGEDGSIRSVPGVLWRRVKNGDL
jgi:hypothetical protein